MHWACWMKLSMLFDGCWLAVCLPFFSPQLGASVQTSFLMWMGNTCVGRLWLCTYPCSDD
jgi:hypothetical protein